jgi:chromosome segregation ATPase
MTDQTEAQRLADRLDLYATGDKHQKDIEDAAAELRRLDAELMRKSDAIQRLWAERDSLRKSMAQLLEALEDAADDIEAWGAYASGYFQTKHDLLGAVNKARAAIAAAKEQA